ncbi:MAG: hypothetical protein IKQ46_00375 [Bacteroidales bacterium]|nr:hypothetical protein [Bacteroidales bacterium]
MKTHTLLVLAAMIISIMLISTSCEQLNHNKEKVDNYTRIIVNFQK